MRRYFMAGLAFLLPAVLTVIITMFLINLLTQPFQGMIRSLVGSYQLSFLGSPEVIVVLSKILILILLFLFIMVLGFVARMFLVNRLFKFSDSIMSQIPLVNKIYRALQDVMTTLFAPESNSFSQVVLVPFPKTNSWSIGLISQADVPKGSDEEHMGLLSVFVPGTPNPTMGFMLLFRRDKVIFLDMSVDEAVRFVVSCGSINARFMKESVHDEQSILK